MYIFSVGHCPLSEFALQPYIDVPELRRLVESYLPISIAQLQIIQSVLNRYELPYVEEEWERYAYEHEWNMVVCTKLMTIRFQHEPRFLPAHRQIFDLLDTHRIDTCRQRFGDCFFGDSR